MPYDMFQRVDRVSENDTTALCSIMCSLATHAYVWYIFNAGALPVQNNFLR